MPASWPRRRAFGHANSRLRRISRCRHRQMQAFQADSATRQALMIFPGGMHILALITLLNTRGQNAYMFLPAITLVTTKNGRSRSAKEGHIGGERPRAHTATIAWPHHFSNARRIRYTCSDLFREKARAPPLLVAAPGRDFWRWRLRWLSAAARRRVCHESGVRMPWGERRRRMPAAHDVTSPPFEERQGKILLYHRIDFSFPDVDIISIDDEAHFYATFRSFRSFSLAPLHHR